MPTTLPARPSVEYYRKQAKALVRAHRAGSSAAALRVRLVLGPRGGEPLALSDAQHVLAREHGHASWAAFAAAIRAASGATAAALQAAARGWDEDGEATLETARSYAAGRPVRVRVRRRGSRYDIDDGAGAVRAAGAPEGWPATAERVVATWGLNVNRAGVVFVPAREGRDLAALVDRVADASLAVFDALAEAPDGLRRLRSG